MEGLQPGERVVTSGNFLIDSESRMRSALGAAPRRPADPNAPPATHPH
jgi:Cu(I)/Ag(I) efflux system membrane fusion protein